MVEFGEIQKVDPRSIWKHEAHDFTPWLEENIEKLGDTLGIELELSEREAAVGDFSVDLLAVDLGRNANVIIENQLAITDHDHLGKLITYASGFEAEVIVWLSTKIREEHRQALDWLNRRTDSNTDFFGVVVEVIRIGDSPPALQFRVAVSPNEWQKTSKRGSSVATSEKSEKYRLYFQGLLDDLRENHQFTGAKKGQPQNWYTFAYGNRLFSYSHSFAQGGRARTEIYIDCGEREDNKNFFDSLYNDRAKIESQYGCPLEWERLDDRQGCRIAIYRDGSIDSSDDELQEIHSWAIENLLKMKQVFGKKK